MKSWKTFINLHSAAMKGQYFHIWLCSNKWFELSLCHDFQQPRLQPARTVCLWCWQFGPTINHLLWDSHRPLHYVSTLWPAVISAECSVILRRCSETVMRPSRVSYLWCFYEVTLQCVNVGFVSRIMYFWLYVMLRANLASNPKLHN